MDGFTITQLFLLCREEIKNGNGDKRIYISEDDEGNGFHKLYFSFTTDPSEIRALMDGTGSRYEGRNGNENTIAILG